ncbi:MAG TPA: hypothetical protein VKB64_08635 [Gaiellaceae bacterium]|nr:hypothetical protein [Gaiellaceae bacterium]
MEEPRATREEDLGLNCSSSATRGPATGPSGWKTIACGRSTKLELELRAELGEGRYEGIELARSLVGQPVVLSVHGGLSEGAFGERLKKAETLVVDAAGRPVRRFRV